MPALPRSRLVPVLAVLLALHGCEEERTCSKEASGTQKLPNGQTEGRACCSSSKEMYIVGSVDEKGAAADWPQDDGCCKKDKPEDQQKCLEDFVKKVKAGAVTTKAGGALLFKETSVLEVAAESGTKAKSVLEAASSSQAAEIAALRAENAAIRQANAALRAEQEIEALRAENAALARENAGLRESAPHHLTEDAREERHASTVSIDRKGVSRALPKLQDARRHFGEEAQ